MRQEIVCEDNSVLQLKKMAQLHGIFRNDLLESFVASSQIPSVCIKKAESDTEVLSEPREAEDIEVDNRDTSEGDECDFVPTRDFDSSRIIDEDDVTSRKVLQAESSTMITKYCAAIRPASNEKPQPKKTERVHRFDTNNRYANKHLD